MASTIIGRVPCLLRCGHEAAHVKLKTDKEAGKEALPYVYCPGCGVMVHTRNKQQMTALAALTRPENSAPAPVPVPTPTPTGKIDPVDVPEPVPAPIHPPKPAGFLDALFGGGLAA